MLNVFITMHMQNSQQGIVRGTSAEHRKVIDLRYYFLEVTRQLDQGVFGWNSVNEIPSCFYLIRLGFCRKLIAGVRES